MDKRQSRGKKNRGKKGKKSAEKESTEGPSGPSFICPIPIEGGSDQFDVFLSFESSDTGKKFTDHLYHSLVKEGTVPIAVFKDGESIPIGEDFAPQILGAITRSKISIPIISKNYATSKWCLRELVHMMDRRKSTSHIVRPIFYEVRAWDVGHLKGKFGEAYHSRKECFDKDDIPKFEQALRDVSGIQGWESEIIVSGHEGELVQKVVDTVLSELRRDFELDVTKHLVGIDDHFNKIRNWALSPATNARMIGIYGMGGIGKTTLAKAIYNELSKEFRDRSYIPDIRDTAYRNGIPYVQNQLIKDILPNEREVSKVDDGVSLIKSRFKSKKVLIILDDIDHLNQLKALARERDWFMARSIIIVTTRDEAVLDQSEFEVDLKYPMNGLDQVDSMLLFNKHAFRTNYSSGNFEDISHEIISTMGGLPLALQVVGSYLFGKTNLNVWKDTLKQLRQHPHEDVQAILKISYDALKVEHREIFLDIACFFVGKKSKFARYMWDDSGFYASQGIEELKLRCLIKIEDDDVLRMHDQLRDLGRSIVGHGQPLERRSRLWCYEEASTVLMEMKGTQSVEAISLSEYHDHSSPDSGQLQVYTNEQFKNLQSVRFLELGRAALSGDFTEQFPKLRWLRWSGIEPMSLPVTNLHLPNLVVLQMSRNGITDRWGGWSSVAKRLKVLNLAYCGDLICTPDFSTFTELEILILNGCDKLERLHPSIGQVNSLVSLDLSHCTSLQSLPDLPSALISLKITCRIPTVPPLSYLINLQELDLFLCLDLNSLPKLPPGLLKRQLAYCIHWMLYFPDIPNYSNEVPFADGGSIFRSGIIAQMYRQKRFHFKSRNSRHVLQGIGCVEPLREIILDLFRNIESLILPGLQGLKQLTVHSCDD